MSRRRRSGYAHARAIEPIAKATASADPYANISDVITMGATRLPEMETYWMLHQKHPWVAACVNLIANTVSADGYGIDPVGNAEKDDDDPRIEQIEQFMAKGFVGMSQRRARYALAVDILVFGRAFLRKKRAGRLVVGLERYDPRLVLPKPNANRTAIETYLIRSRKAIDTSSPEMIGSSAFMASEPVKPEDIIFFNRGGGDQLLGAPSPLEHLDLTIGLDFAIRQHRQGFFKNGAVPGMVMVNTDGNRDQILAAEAMIRNTKRGADNAYATWMLSGSWEVKSRGTETVGQKDIDFAKGSSLNRDEICAVYHVPPGKLLFAAGALGSSGKAEDDATFQEQCVLPLEESIYEHLTKGLLVDEFDILDLEFAPKRRHSLRYDMFEKAAQVVNFGGTINEARGLVNLPPIDSTKFDVDAPLLGAHTGPNVASDEPLSASESTSQQIATPDEQDDGVAKTGAKGKAWY